MHHWKTYGFAQKLGDTVPRPIYGMWRGKWHLQPWDFGVQYVQTNPNKQCVEKPWRVGWFKGSTVCSWRICGIQEYAKELLLCCMTQAAYHTSWNVRYVLCMYYVCLCATICIYIYDYLGFPEIGVLPNRQIIHFNGIFHSKPSSYWGASIYGTPGLNPPLYAPLSQ